MKQLLALAATVTVLAACGGETYGAPESAGRSDNDPSAATSQEIRHVLYTHCGLVSTTVDGVLWLADPPLADGGNPPPGWDENETQGVFRQIDAERAVFVADSGVEAIFTKAGPGATDAEADCD